MILMARGRPAVAYVAQIRDAPLTGHLSREPEIDVRASSLVLDQLDQLEMTNRANIEHSETTLAPRRVVIDDEGVSMQLATSNYARFMAAAQLFGAYTHDEQGSEFNRYSTGTPPWFSHSLGVNCSLQTSDDKLLWTVRPQHAEIEPGVVAPVMNEGSNICDLDGDAWAPERVARRGFHEELGFATDDTDITFSFYAIVAQFGNGGLAVMGHARTPLTLQQVIEQHYNAADSHEHENGIFACDANPESLLTFLDTHPVDEWSTWGLASLHHVSQLVNAEVPDLEMISLDTEPALN
jgi:hypothetical protein